MTTGFCSWMISDIVQEKKVQETGRRNKNGVSKGSKVEESKIPRGKSPVLLKLSEKGHYFCFVVSVSNPLHNDTVPSEHTAGPHVFPHSPTTPSSRFARSLFSEVEGVVH